MASRRFQPCGLSVGLRYAPASSKPAGLEAFAFARTLFAFARNAAVRTTPAGHAQGRAAGG